MNESSDEPPLTDRIRSWAREKAYDSRFNPFGDDASSRTLPVANPPPPQRHGTNHHSSATTAGPSRTDSGGYDVDDKRASAAPPPAPPPVGEEPKGEEPTSMTDEPKQGTFKRFCMVAKTIILSSWINIALVFVPVGIALGAMNKASGAGHVVTPSAVFAINAVAIIPLAGLLSYATESVAAKLGDTMGALLNVSFGNAVELIIFIALVAKEIRIVQASLLGSILANLLLILGMCFLFGGLRFREQLYNSTVTQMSACLLSLSVISLLLPTAFHASFNRTDLADKAVIKVSRGTSVILLVVYVLYLLFQLKSHAYMYESTPQHKIDEESHPGVLADFLGSSSSSDSSSSSSDDSDDSSKSTSTAKRFRRRFKRRKRRKSSASSKDTQSMPSVHESPNVSARASVFEDGTVAESSFRQAPGRPLNLDAVESGDEADTDRAGKAHRRRAQPTDIKSRDFQTGETTIGTPPKSPDPESKNKRSKKHHKSSKKARVQEELDEKTKIVQTDTHVSDNSGPSVGFIGDINDAADTSSKRPFNILNLSNMRPALPRVLASNVFTQPPQPNQLLPTPNLAQNSSPLRRTSSLPDRLNQRYVTQAVPASIQPLPHLMPTTSHPAVNKEEQGKKHLSRNSSIMLLLISTGLVAVCAEFLVDSINYLVNESGVSQAFIGLIILPIVGNAAEHVTAVTVASKNKMDLAIGVAVGSSIQIALFVTPVIVLLGWCLDTEMSLYFSLFETVSLFVSAFIVGFLILDGRSNYLEGALLIAAYVIIAVLAFYYPSCEQLSTASGPHDSSGSC